MLSWKCLKTCVPVLVLLSGLLGCAAPQATGPVAVNVLAGEPGSTATLLPAGDEHLVTARAAPGSVATTPVFCAEPSPDFARTFGHAYGATAGVAAAGSGGLSASDSEAVTAMLGRSAGVVALRDGLYSACEAYANGIIGRDAYGLIISQYGTLLAQLAGAGTTDPAVLQQQAVQALLVACITDADPSVPPGVGQGRPNPLLDANCPALMSKIVASVPALLKPAPPPKAPTQAAPAPAAPAKPKAAA